MDLKIQSVRYHQFYYAGQPGTGQMITCASSTDKAVRNTVKNICCTLNYTGTAPETRLVWSAELGSYCKAYLRPDGRNYFYHIVIPDPETVNADSLADAAMRNTEPAQVSHELKDLPVLTRDVELKASDTLRLILHNDVTAMAAFLQCAFRPFLFRGITSRLSVPAPATALGAYDVSEEARTLADLLLAVLPESMRRMVRLRFSSSPEEYAKMYDCTHAVLTDATDANFILHAPVRAGQREDIHGLFTAMAEYICTNGITAYRRTVCPVIDRWYTICVGVGEIRLSSLLPLLQFETALRFEGRFSVVRELEYYLLNGNAEWFDGYADALCEAMQSEQVCLDVRNCLLKNTYALSERTAEQLKGKESDGFLRVLARSFRFSSVEEKCKCLEVFFKLYAETEEGMSVVLAMKREMELTFTVPESAKPNDLFDGIRILEVGNPVYLDAASRTAVASFIADGNTQWLEVLKPLLCERAYVKTVVGHILGNFENLISKCADMEWLHLLCINYGSCLPDTRKKNVMELLRQKKLTWDEMQSLGREMKLSEDDMPQAKKSKKEKKPKKEQKNKTEKNAEPMPVTAGSLKKTADAVAANATKRTAAWKTSVLEQLITVLEGDCIWSELRTELPKILDALEYTPDNKLHTRIETALARQMAIQAPFVCDSTDGKAGYLHYMEKMNERYGLVLCPQTELIASRLRCGGRVPVSFGEKLKRILWLLPLIAITVVAVAGLFVSPATPENIFGKMMTAVCLLAMGAGALLVQILLRRDATRLYLMPAGTVALLAGILYFLLA